jgi:hypothetical protein
MSVMAGETSSPPCAPPEGGETSSPPCVASEILPGDANGNQAINNTQAPGTESINQIAFDLLQTLLTIF